MKKSLLYLLLTGLILVACEKDDVGEDPKPVKNEDSELEVEEFVFRGMEEFYLYEADVPEFRSGYFKNDDEKQEFLASFASPENLFSHLTVPEDEFSYITDDYHALNDQFDGKSGATGIEYGIGGISNSNNIFGFITYVLPGSSAEEEGLTRGTLFTEIDGTKLTMSNFVDLISQKSFEITLAYIDRDGYLVTSDETATLEDRSYTANPIYLDTIYEYEGQKIGYLMYNSFIANFDDELNAVFGEFKSQNINHLILDLRYNGGGSVASAVSLASMVTGQFEGEIFMKEQWNEKYQTYFETYQPDYIFNYFDDKIRTGEAINSLNLSEVYVITGYQTASASELIINGLRPYINVVQVGETTTGKFQGSITLYDEPDLTSEDKANPDHTYAMQPLVFKTANALGHSDYAEGLDPDLPLKEDIVNMGVLGDPSERLLQATLDQILGRQQMMRAMFHTTEKFEIIGGKEMFDPKVQRMYSDKVPPLLSKSFE